MHDGDVNLDSNNQPIFRLVVNPSCFRRFFAAIVNDAGIGLNVPSWPNPVNWNRDDVGLSDAAPMLKLSCLRWGKKWSLPVYNRQIYLGATLRLLQLVAVFGKELFEGRNVCFGFFGRS